MSLSFLLWGEPGRDSAGVAVVLRSCAGWESSGRRPSTSILRSSALGRRIGALLRFCVSTERYGSVPLRPKEFFVSRERCGSVPLKPKKGLDGPPCRAMGGGEEFRFGTGDSTKELKPGIQLQGERAMRA